VQATSFFIQPFPDFTRNAPNIVHGKLHQPRAEYAVTQNGDRSIHTYADLEIKEVLKGSITGQNILIRKAGGTKDGVTLHIPGSPEFQEGEESVFYLSNEIPEDHCFEVVGLELGKFGITEKNGEKIITGGLLGFSSGQEANEGIGPGIVENQRTWSLRQLRSLIETQRAEEPASSASASSTSGARPSPKPSSFPSGTGSSATGQASSGPESSSEKAEPNSMSSRILETEVPASAKIAGVLFILAAVLLGTFLYLRRK